MIRYDYHSYRSPAARGANIQPNELAFGIELEVKLDRRLFADATTVRGARAERDGSLIAADGDTEFVFTPTSDIGNIVRRFRRLKERVAIYSPQDNAPVSYNYYGMHVNVNALGKDEHWYACLAGVVNFAGNAGTWRNIARRTPYSGPNPYTSFSSMASRGRYWTSRRENRIELRLFSASGIEAIAVGQICVAGALSMYADSLVYTSIRERSVGDNVWWPRMMPRFRISSFLAYVAEQVRTANHSADKLLMLEYAQLYMRDALDNPYTAVCNQALPIVGVYEASYRDRFAPTRRGRPRLAPSTSAVEVRPALA
jgi:hypothetical protein